MLGSLGDRLFETSLDDAVVNRVAGMWNGDAGVLVIDLAGPDHTERLVVEHDGKLRFKLAGPPMLSHFVADMLPPQAMIQPAAASDEVLAFEIPALGDRGAPFGVGAYVEPLLGVEWASPKFYEAHAIRGAWALWSQGLVILRAESTHSEYDEPSRIAWWPSSGGMVRTAAVQAEPMKIVHDLHPVARKRWKPETDEWAQPSDALEALVLPQWPEEGWLV